MMADKNVDKSVPQTDPADDGSQANGTNPSRRRFLAGMIGAGGAMCLTAPSAFAHSTAWKQPGNNNKLLDAQYEELPSQKAGEVKVDYKSRRTLDSPNLTLHRDEVGEMQKEFLYFGNEVTLS